jgi:DnaJ-class molecular chaperone
MSTQKRKAASWESCRQCGGDGHVNVKRGLYDASAPCPGCKRERKRKSKCNT